MKVTIRYMDNSVSIIELPGDNDNYIIGSNNEYFTIQETDDDEKVVGWIVRENVKYVVMGEMIENFKDTSEEEVKDTTTRGTRSEYGR